MNEEKRKVKNEEDGGLGGVGAASGLRPAVIYRDGDGADPAALPLVTTEAVGLPGRASPGRDGGGDRRRQR